MEVTARKLFIVGALFTIAISPAAAGRPLAVCQHWGRWIGYGWSEGYHARDEMPSRRTYAKRSPHLIMHGPTMLPPQPRSGVEFLPVPSPQPDIVPEPVGNR